MLSLVLGWKVHSWMLPESWLEAAPSYLQSPAATHHSLINNPKRARKGGVTLVSVMYAAITSYFNLFLYCRLCAEALSHSRDCHTAAQRVLALAQFGWVWS